MASRWNASELDPTSRDGPFGKGKRYTSSDAVEHPALSVLQQLSVERPVKRGRKARKVTAAAEQQAADEFDAERGADLSHLPVWETGELVNIEDTADGLWNVDDSAWWIRKGVLEPVSVHAMATVGVTGRRGAASQQPAINPKLSEGLAPGAVARGLGDAATAAAHAAGWGRVDPSLLAGLSGLLHTCGTDKPSPAKARKLYKHALAHLYYATTDIMASHAFTLLEALSALAIEYSDCRVMQWVGEVEAGRAKGKGTGTGTGKGKGTGGGEGAGANVDEDMSGTGPITPRSTTSPPFHGPRVHYQYLSLLVGDGSAEEEEEQEEMWAARWNGGEGEEEEGNNAGGREGEEGGAGKGVTWALGNNTGFGVGVAGGTGAAGVGIGAGAGVGDKRPSRTTACFQDADDSPSKRICRAASGQGGGPAGRGLYLSHVTSLCSAAAHRVQQGMDVAGQWEEYLTATLCSSEGVKPYLALAGAVALGEPDAAPCISRHRGCIAALNLAYESCRASEYAAGIVPARGEEEDEEDSADGGAGGRAYDDDDEEEQRGWDEEDQDDEYTPGGREGWGAGGSGGGGGGGGGGRGAPGARGSKAGAGAGRGRGRGGRGGKSGRNAGLDSDSDRDYDDEDGGPSPSKARRGGRGGGRGGGGAAGATGIGKKRKRPSRPRKPAGAAGPEGLSAEDQFASPNTVHDLLNGTTGTGGSFGRGIGIGKEAILGPGTDAVSTPFLLAAALKTLTCDGAYEVKPPPPPPRHHASEVAARLLAIAAHLPPHMRVPLSGLSDATSYSPSLPSSPDKPGAMGMSVPGSALLFQAFIGMDQASPPAPSSGAGAGAGGHSAGSSAVGGESSYSSSLGSSLGSPGGSRGCHPWHCVRTALVWAASGLPLLQACGLVVPMDHPFLPLQPEGYAPSPLSGLMRLAGYGHDAGQQQLAGALLGGSMLGGAAGAMGGGGAGSSLGGTKGSSASASIHFGSTAVSSIFASLPLPEPVHTDLRLYVAQEKHKGGVMADQASLAQQGSNSSTTASTTIAPGAFVLPTQPPSLADWARCMLVDLSTASAAVARRVMQLVPLEAPGCGQCSGAEGGGGLCGRDPSILPFGQALSHDEKLLRKAGGRLHIAMAVASTMADVIACRSENLRLGKMLKGHALLSPSVVDIAQSVRTVGQSLLLSSVATGEGQVQGYSSGTNAHGTSSGTGSSSTTAASPTTADTFIDALLAMASHVLDNGHTSVAVSTSSSPLPLYSQSTTKGSAGAGAGAGAISGGAGASRGPAVTYAPAPVGSITSAGSISLLTCCLEAAADYLLAAGRVQEEAAYKDTNPTAGGVPWGFGAAFFRGLAADANAGAGAGAGAAGKGVAALADKQKAVPRLHPESRGRRAALVQDALIALLGLQPQVAAAYPSPSFPRSRELPLIVDGATLPSPSAPRSIAEGGYWRLKERMVEAPGASVSAAAAPPGRMSATSRAVAASASSGLSSSSPSPSSSSSPPRVLLPQHWDCLTQLGRLAAVVQGEFSSSTALARGVRWSTAPWEAEGAMIDATAGWVGALCAAAHAQRLPMEGTAASVLRMGYEGAYVGGPLATTSTAGVAGGFPPTLPACRYRSALQEQLSVPPAAARPNITHVAYNARIALVASRTHGKVGAVRSLGLDRQGTGTGEDTAAAAAAVLTRGRRDAAGGASGGAGGGGGARGDTQDFDKDENKGAGKGKEKGKLGAKSSGGLVPAVPTPHAASFTYSQLLRGSLPVLCQFCKGKTTVSMAGFSTHNGPHEHRYMACTHCQEPFLWACWVGLALPYPARPGQCETISRYTHMNTDCSAMRCAGCGRQGGARREIPHPTYGSNDDEDEVIEILDSATSEDGVGGEGGAGGGAGGSTGGSSAPRGPQAGADAGAGPSGSGGMIGGNGLGAAGSLNSEDVLMYDEAHQLEADARLAEQLSRQWAEEDVAEGEQQGGDEGEDSDMGGAGAGAGGAGAGGAGASRGGRKARGTGAAKPKATTSSSSSAVASAGAGRSRGAVAASAGAGAPAPAPASAAAPAPAPAPAAAPAPARAPAAAPAAVPAPSAAPRVPVFTGSPGQSAPFEQSDYDATTCGVCRRIPEIFDENRVECSPACGLGFHLACVSGIESIVPGAYKAPSVLGGGGYGSWHCPSCKLDREASSESGKAASRAQAVKAIGYAIERCPDWLNVHPVSGAAYTAHVFSATDADSVRQRSVFRNIAGRVAADGLLSRRQIEKDARLAQAVSAAAAAGAGAGAGAGGGAGGSVRSPAPATGSSGARPAQPSSSSSSSYAPSPSPAPASAPSRALAPSPAPAPGSLSRVVAAHNPFAGAVSFSFMSGSSGARASTGTPAAASAGASASGAGVGGSSGLGRPSGGSAGAARPAVRAGPAPDMDEAAL